MRKQLLGEVTSHILLTDIAGKKQAIRHATHSSSLKEKQQVSLQAAMTLNEIFRPVIKSEEKKRREKKKELLT